jgi:WD40 repeat protein
LDLVTLPQLDQLVGIGTSRSVIRCAAFLPDGDTVLAGRFNGDVIVYEYKHGHWLARGKTPLTSHEGRVEGIKVLPDRSVIVSAGSEGRIQFMPLQGGHPIGEARVPSGRVTSLHISPDRSFMAVGNSEASLSLWDLRMLDMRRLLMQPFARATVPALGTLDVLIGNESLPSRARLVLKFASTVLRHRFRFDIELDEAAIIMSGEFDIEIE